MAEETIKKWFIVKNDRGLHTRPSTELVKCASSFRATIMLHCHGLTVNSKSLLGILMLAAHRGSKIRVEATGEDAELAVESILKLAENKFNINY